MPQLLPLLKESQTLQLQRLIPVILLNEFHGIAIIIRGIV